ncbi:TetR/AcrR family transcriptional regulator [Lactobacillus sp. PV034]|uniref:TetR/AcrR family transcriptional regulator n=1 Tax=Lactobacillus sp. PV034 TaxID=2594495 RepID=UPI002240A4ED|nr:TetR/AcrR family transcriptional regulator [Lactobacillus sp. PV034]QNQ81044.1 TetR/AcrR family transcriptional regulator [Lactobacillus sp. PV034]
MARQKNMKRRRTILRNTFDLLQEDRMQRVSLQKIADKSGISKSLLQSYYPHKSKLIIEIVTTYMSTVLNALSYDEINFNNEFVRMKVFTYIIMQLGAEDEATARVLESSIKDQASTAKWLERLQNWLEQEEVVDKLGGSKAMELGLTFVIPGTVTLFLKREELNLDPEQITDMMIKSYMATFAGASQSEIKHVLSEGHEIIKNFDISKIFNLLNHMFDEKEDGKDK